MDFNSMFGNGIGQAGQAARLAALGVGNQAGNRTLPTLGGPAAMLQQAGNRTAGMMPQQMQMPQAQATPEAGREQSQGGLLGMLGNMGIQKMVGNVGGQGQQQTQPAAANPGAPPQAQPMQQPYPSPVPQDFSQPMAWNAVPGSADNPLDIMRLLGRG